MWSVGPGRDHGQDPQRVSSAQQPVAVSPPCDAQATLAIAYDAWNRALRALLVPVYHHNAEQTDRSFGTRVAYFRLGMFVTTWECGVLGSGLL